MTEDALEAPAESSALAEFLFPAPAPRSVGGIVKWWEKRRLPYNVIVGAAGLVTLTYFQIVVGWVWGEGAVPWQMPVAFGVMANLCYLLGPTVEILAHKLFGRDLLPVGPALYRMGLTFSVGLALLPSLLLTIMIVVRVLIWPF